MTIDDINNKLKGSVGGIQVNHPVGWICPKCQSVYSPSWYTCMKCSNMSPTSTRTIYNTTVPKDWKEML